MSAAGRSLVSRRLCRSSTSHLVLIECQDQHGKDFQRRRRRTQTHTLIARPVRLKELCFHMFPKANSAQVFSEARRAVSKRGLDDLRYELLEEGFIDSDTDLMITNFKPCNIFACIAAGVISQDNMSVEQLKLGEFSKDYVVAHNRPDCDLHWNSNDSAWIGRASMSKRHVFLTVKDLHWEWFNVLTFGLVSGAERGVAKLMEMKEAALRWTDATDGWPAREQVGLFFHVYGHSSVPSCHLHVVDLSNLGPTFAALQHRNLSLDAAVAVLEHEARAASRIANL